MLNIYNQRNNAAEEIAEDEKKPAKEIYKKSNIRNYTDASGEIGSKGLEGGIWFVGHRVLLYRIILGSIAAIAAIFWIFSLVKWGMFFLDWQKHGRALKQLTVFPNYTKINPQFQPEDLQILETLVLPGGENKSDAVAEVINPNDHHLVKFDYYFLNGDVPTQKKHAVLLPGQTGLITTLGLDEAELGSEAIPVIEKVAWTRISAHKVPDPETWQKERLDFSAKNFVFTPASFGDEVAANRITFDLTNNSSFGYVEPEFYVGLLDGDSLVGVLPLTVSGLKSGETKLIDLRSFARNLRGSDIRLYPLINLYDQEVYSRLKP